MDYRCESQTWMYTTQTNPLIVPREDLIPFIIVVCATRATSNTETLPGVVFSLRRTQAQYPVQAQAVEMGPVQAKASARQRESMLVPALALSVVLAQVLVLVPVPLPVPVPVPVLVLVPV